MKLHIYGIIAISMFALAACTAEAPPAAEPEMDEAAAPAAPPPFRHAVSMNQMMVDVINDHSHAIWDIDIPGNEPETDEDWTEIRHASVVLAAAGSLTVVGGAGESDDEWVTQPSWVAMSQALSDAGLQALDAAERRNLDALRTAGNELVLTCVNCHRAYRLDVPNIWAEIDNRIPEN